MDTLIHFGVKGMKWGVHKKSDVPASEDHIRAESARQKAKTGGGHKVLSNKELQDVIARLNLEQQFARLNPSAVKQGQQIVQELLGLGQTVNTAVNFANTTVSKIRASK